MMSKIAIITDVHGNAPALRAALAAIDSHGAVEQIYCLGDMLGIGPDANEVLELLFARPDVTMIRGNHDDYVLAVLAGQQEQVPRQVLAHEQWVAARLSPRFVPLLAALPHSLNCVHGGRKLLLRHYHHDPKLVYASVDQSPTAERLDAIYAAEDADVVCFGHHHPVHRFRSDRRLYVNPGALGCCDQPVARYGVLELGPETVDVELFEVPYDRTDFLASYEALQVPDREFILKVFHGQG